MTLDWLTSAQVKWAGYIFIWFEHKEELTSYRVPLWMETPRLCKCTLFMLMEPWKYFFPPAFHGPVLFGLWLTLNTTYYNFGSVFPILQAQNWVGNFLQEGTYCHLNLGFLETQRSSSPRILHLCLPASQCLALSNITSVSWTKL